MIKGVNVMFYSEQAEELRCFLRDKLQIPCSIAGGGWLIFDLPEAELGCHPPALRKGQPSGAHRISFYCEDIERTVSTLRLRGVEFVSEIRDKGYGRSIRLQLPGGPEVEIYEPHYTKDPAPALYAPEPGDFLDFDASYDSLIESIDGS